MLILSEVTASKLPDTTEGLAKAGLEYQTHTDPVAREYGVLAAGRVPFERHVGELPPVALVRWLELRWNGLHILGAHLPSANDKAPLSTEQAPFWAWLETYLATQLDQPAVLIGDLSTDRAESGLACAASFDRVEASGWTDLVRKHTDAEDVASFWLHSGKTHTGYLMDHALATPSFAARVESVGVPMSLGEHEFVRSAGASGLSDHAPVVVDIRRG